MANRAYTYTNWSSTLTSDYSLLSGSTQWSGISNTNLSSQNLICDKYSGDTAISTYGNNHIEAFFVFSATSIVTASTVINLDKIEYLNDAGTTLSSNTTNSLYSASTTTATYTGASGFEILNKVKNSTSYTTANGITLYKCITNQPFSGCTDKYYIFRIPIQNYYYPNGGTATKRKLTFTITFQTEDEEIKKIQQVTVTQVGSQLIS